MKYQKSILKTMILTMAVSIAACGEAPAANGKPAQASQHTQPQTLAINKEVEKNIIDTLNKQFANPMFKVHSIQTTPVSGLYEVVVTGNQIIYTDATGQYMFIGELIDLNNERNLTGERLSQLNRIDFQSLPLDKAITEIRGNGELKIAVFSDADCPFCQRLEKEFAKMDNITIYNFMMPIASLHPDAYQKTVQILCQTNPTEAWTNWMRHKKMPPQVANCQHSLDETLALAQKFGFNGTPTLIFPNGKVTSGYIPMPQLEEEIRQNQK